LRQRVTLQRLTVEKDERGQDVQTWQTVAMPWAQVEVLSGNEAVQAMQVHPEAKYQVSLRWRPDLRADDRIIYHDGFSEHVLAIVGPPIDRYQRREELVLTCAEVQP